MPKKESQTAAQKPFCTISDLEVENVYNADHLSKGHASSAAPGKFPYTRGIHKDMYRGRLWTMRQYAGFGDAQESNQRFRFLLEQGNRGLSVAFDLPTQMGRDPDHTLAHGEVGRVGVSISTLDDMRSLLRDLPLDQISVSMTINATAPILLAFLLVLAEERKIPWQALNGTVQNDILKEYIARGTYIYPPRHAMRLVTDVMAFCSQQVPCWNTISISGYHMREAGCTAVQELAFTLADGICYVESAIKAGLDVDSFAPRLAFFFNCHNDFLEEIAKFRAARRMWATIMQQRFAAKREESKMLRFHTQTAGSSLVAQQPLNNIVRTTIQALAAVLGGTQSLHTNSFDEALGLPTQNSAQIALRTQQIIAHESGVTNSVDPMGGSYLIENWTDRLEQEANKLIEKIDQMGGMLAALEKQFPQEEIEKAAYIYHRSVENKQRIVVGLNDFLSQEDQSPELQALNQISEEKRIAALQAYKAKRDSQIVSIALQSLNNVAKGSSNLMPAILECVRKGATLGEIADEQRKVFGEQH